MRNKVKQIKYLCYFVARSLLISILFFLSLLGIVFIYYYGDYFVSASKGVYKSPLFGAYVIVSPSMVPTIKIDDAIIIKRIDNDKYKIGDIVTYNSKDINYRGKAVTHRIIDKKDYTKNNSLYQTKGDNNDIADPILVETNDIYGKVLLRIPAVGKLRTIAASPANFFLSLLIPTMIFIFYELGRIYIMMSKRKI